MTEKIPELVLITPGRAIEYSGPRSSAKRTVVIDRKWQVWLDGKLIGYVHYVMVERERRIPGKRYVSSRWKVPGWKFSGPERDRSWEAFSRKQAVETLVSWQ